MRDRNYIDSEIKKGKFASYGHCLRALLHYYRVMGRENSKLRSENARIKGILEVVQDKDLYRAEQVHTQVSESNTKRD